MSSLVESYLGIPLQVQKIVPGNTATGIAASVYTYREYEIGYDSGDYAFLAGDVIVGATSGATGVVVSVTVATGTVGGGNAAGKIRFKSWNGTNFTDDEHIKVGSDSDVGDINGSAPIECADPYLHKGKKAAHLLITARTQAVLLALDGSTGDQTALLGVRLLADTSYIIHDAQEMAQAKFIDYAAGSAGTVIVLAYF